MRVEKFYVRIGQTIKLKNPFGYQDDLGIFLIVLLSNFQIILNLSLENTLKSFESSLVPCLSIINSPRVDVINYGELNGPSEKLTKEILRYTWIRYTVSQASSFHTPDIL